ncbi:MAG TPA: HEAT repeat domain-containing protein, partial [Planctomycetaceae bacterium]|nr:HEAT repeat domain-containing protein [Planctomycetaceae bacterium]
MLTMKNTSVSRGLGLGNRRSVLPRFRTLLVYLVYLAVPCALTGGPHANAQESPGVRLSPKQRAACLRVLREGMEGDEFWPSIHAVEGLIEAGEAATVVPWLERKLAQETDDQRRCGLARELVRAGHRSATRVLLEILADSKSNGRTHAAESLYKVAEIGDGRVLRQLLADASDPPRQIMAAAALARWGHPEAFRLLRQRLANPQSQRQLQLAAWVLARVGDRSDIPALRKALPKAKEPLVRAYIEHALARLGDPDGQARLLRNLESSDGAVRTYAATFAGEVRDPRASPTAEKPPEG